MDAEPRKYETLYLLRPDISPEDVSTILARMEQSVANNGGKVVKSEKWAERDLAYPINNYTKGIYYIMVYSAEPGAVTDIEKYFNLSKNNVLRFMTVNYLEPTRSGAGAGPVSARPPETSPRDERSGFSAPAPAGDGGAKQ